MRLCERGHEVDSVAGVDRTRRRIPEATVARLPVYLRTLAEMRDSQVTTVSWPEKAFAGAPMFCTIKSGDGLICTCTGSAPIAWLFSSPASKLRPSVM